MNSVTSWILIFKCSLVETKLLRWVGMQRAVTAGWLHSEESRKCFFIWNMGIRLW